MLKIITVGAFLLSLTHSCFAAVVLTDITGKTVEILAPARRIILLAPPYYPALAVLNKDAADLVVGVGRDNDGPYPFETERDLIGKPSVGSTWSQTFSIEKALALNPDLVIAGIPGKLLPSTIEKAFSRAGVPLIHVDFFVDPARNSIRSFQIIGKAIGEEENAREFIDFQRSHEKRITERLRGTALSRPKLFVNSRAPGSKCCTTGQGGVTTYFDGLGVDNIADNKLPDATGEISLEYVIESNPDIYVATDLTTGPSSLFGKPLSRANAIASLEKIVTEPGLREIPAVRNARVHVVDVSLTRSPLNILVLEVFAKWVHPELFADIDPQATLDEINRRFLKTPLKGPFWASLDPAAERHSGIRP